MKRNTAKIFFVCAQLILFVAPLALLVANLFDLPVILSGFIVGMLFSPVFRWMDKIFDRRWPKPKSGWVE